MAFKLKSKLTSGGLMGHPANKPKLINNTKTQFFQELPENFVATEMATKLDGTRVPVEGYTEETKVYEGARPYEEVYNEFEIDTATGEAINPINGARYSNIQEFKDDAKEDSKITTLYKGSYDSTSGTPDRKVIPDEFKGLYKLYQRLGAGTIQGGPDAWFKVLDNRGIDSKSEEFRNYMQTQKNFATKRKQKEEAKQKRREYCEQNPNECRKRSSSKPPTPTTIKGNPDSETYVVPTVQN